MSRESETEETVTIRETVRDTIIEVRADESTIQALLRCDSAGNVLISQILKYEVGERLKPPQIGIENNILTALARVDSMAIYLQLKDRYKEREKVQTDKERIEVKVNVLTWWQKVRLWIANITLIIIPLYIYFKK